MLCKLLGIEKPIIEWSDLVTSSIELAAADQEYAVLNHLLRSFSFILRTRGKGLGVGIDHAAPDWPVSLESQ